MRNKKKESEGRIKENLVHDEDSKKSSSVRKSLLVIASIVLINVVFGTVGSYLLFRVFHPDPTHNLQQEESAPESTTPFLLIPGRQGEKIGQSESNLSLSKELDEKNDSQALIDKNRALLDKLSSTSNLPTESITSQGVSMEKGAASTQKRASPMGAKTQEEPRLPPPPLPLSAQSKAVDKNGTTVQRGFNLVDAKTQEALKGVPQKKDGLNSKDVIITSRARPGELEKLIEPTNTPAIKPTVLLSLPSLTTTSGFSKIKPSEPGEKPRVAIIIDDVGFLRQAKEIKSIPFKLTPSIFPKGKYNPDTPKIAAQFPFFMVHLPLEAREFYQKEHEWLRVSDSKEKIREKILELKRDFPGLVYLNNHTGSRFTEDMSAMRNFLSALQEEGIGFLDSRTTEKAKAPLVYKEQNRFLLARDVFLDNERSIPYIKRQLQQTIRIAKQRGYAVAIGHPHPETFQALRESVNLKREVEFVYVSELFEP